MVLKKTPMKDVVATSAILGAEQLKVRIMLEKGMDYFDSNEYKRIEAIINSALKKLKKEIV